MHEVQKPPDHFLYGSNLLGVYNKNLGTTKFQYKMSSTFYSTILLLHWQHQIGLYLLFFLPLEMQPLQECNNF